MPDFYGDFLLGVEKMPRPAFQSGLQSDMIAFFANPTRPFWF
jgi:hypothetical protein